MLSACKKIYNPKEEINPGEQQVILRLFMPQQQTKAETYAVSEVNQNSIYTLDVLAFRLTDDGKERFAYSRKGVLLRPNPGATEVNFHVDLLKSTENYRFVLLANGATQLQNALNGLPANAEKETLLNRIEYRIGSKWNAGSTVNFTPFPMWGESGIIPGISNTTSGFSVSMLRSLAAIDVNVTANDFVMTDVLVYNMPDKGRIAPISVNYDVTNRIVTVPSIPTGAFVPLVKQTYATGEKTLSNEIFLFERVAPAGVGQSDATALVIAGKYAGSTNKTYYRLDLTSEDGTPLAILRNHRYAIDITKVLAPGFNSENEAWVSKPIRMTATIKPWNEISPSVMNTQANYLKVSTTQEKVNGLQGELTFNIRTNVTNVTLDLPNWLSLLNDDKEGDKTTYKLYISENSSATTPRTGDIRIRIGRLTRLIKIEQGARPIDLGPAFGFYVFAKNLRDTGFWYRVANVDRKTDSNLDASLTQKSGTPYAESCVANLGEGARLPTITELRQLMPANASERNAINNEIRNQGGTDLPSGNNNYSLYMSSSSFSSAYYKGIRSEGNDDIYGKFGGPDHVWYGNSIGRCVLSK
ncbi:hypothetical protein [Sphingobacterium spiritivorum]